LVNVTVVNTEPAPAFCDPTVPRSALVAQGGGPPGGAVVAEVGAEDPEVVDAPPPVLLALVVLVELDDDELVGTLSAVDGVPLLHPASTSTAVARAAITAPTLLRMPRPPGSSTTPHRCDDRRHGRVPPRPYPHRPPSLGSSAGRLVT
jgi:hypothetical protein